MARKRCFFEGLRLLPRKGWSMTDETGQGSPLLDASPPTVAPTQLPTPSFRPPTDGRTDTLPRLAQSGLRSTGSVPSATGGNKPSPAGPRRPRKGAEARTRPSPDPIPGRGSALAPHGPRFTCGGAWPGGGPFRGGGGGGPAGVPGPSSAAGAAPTWAARGAGETIGRERGGGRAGSGAESGPGPPRRPFPRSPLPSPSATGW